MASNKPAEPATVARICARHGIPEQAAKLIREGATLQQVRERADVSGKVKERVHAAISCGMVSPERANTLMESALQKGTPADIVSNALVNAAYEEQTPDDAVQSRITPDSRIEDPSDSPQAAWRRAADVVASEVESER